MCMVDLSSTVVTTLALLGTASFVVVIAYFCTNFAFSKLSAKKELAAKLASRAPLAMVAAKRLLRTEAPLEEVASTQSRLIRSADALEGIASFLEKRPPRFSGQLEDESAM